MKKVLTTFTLILLVLGAACTPGVSLLAAPTPTGVPTPTETPFPTPTPAPTFDPSLRGRSLLDVTYCTMDGLDQKMDLYLPNSQGPWPVLVYVHGGGWKEGDKAEGSGWSFLNEQGIAVVSLNYRMYAQYKFPAMIEDVKCAIRSLRAHANQYNLDPDHFAALGASAGGHLVSLLGTADDTAGWDVGEYTGFSSRLQAVVPISGPSDLDGGKWPDGMEMLIYVVFGNLPGQHDPSVIAASPVSYISPDDPPFLVIHGNHDGVVPFEQGQLMYDELVQGGVPAEFIVVDKGDHSLNGNGATPTWDEIILRITEFLKEKLLE